MWYIYTMVYCSAFKKEIKTVILIAQMLNIMLTEKNRGRRKNTVKFHLHMKSKNVEKESRMLVMEAEGWRGVRYWSKGIKCQT